MTQKEFEKHYPLILAWIQSTLTEYSSGARSVASLGFSRLPHFFAPAFLAQAKVVYLPEVPMPPLSALGLGQFSGFENMDAGGITYLDTFFSREELRGDEGHHFHELVHVIQWQVLGPKTFVAYYADGLEKIGYRANPLETMAYTLENVFRASQAPFDAKAIVREQLSALYSTGSYFNG